MASELAGLGAVAVGIEAGISLWRGRGFQAEQAQMLGANLGTRLGGDARAMTTGESLMLRYREGSDADRGAAKTALSARQEPC